MESVSYPIKKEDLEAFMVAIERSHKSIIFDKVEPYPYQTEEEKECFGEHIFVYIKFNHYNTWTLITLGEEFFKEKSKPK